MIVVAGISMDLGIQQFKNLITWEVPSSKQMALCHPIKEVKALKINKPR